MGVRNCIDADNVKSIGRTNLLVVDLIFRFDVFLVGKGGKKTGRQPGRETTDLTLNSDLIFVVVVLGDYNNYYYYYSGISQSHYK